MEVQAKQLKRVDLVEVSGRIDGSSAPKLEETLKAITDAERFRIVVDLSGVTYIGSAGLRSLVSQLKTCKRWNRGDLRLAGVSGPIAEVFDMAGLTPLFKIYDNATEAVGSF